MVKKAVAKETIAAPRLHHRAFDHALIGVRTDYTIACSEKEFQRLQSIGWHGGESEFEAALRDQILLPLKKEIYPAPGYLEFGQKLRGWAN
jgi:predicted restriction endonuclease